MPSRSPPSRSVPVAVALVDLDAPEFETVGARTWLTGDEVQRLERTPDAAARRRFTNGRAMLRALVGAKPGEGDFVLGPNGKPHLPGGPHFSIAASDRYGLIAVAPDEPVGVDIEIVRDVDLPADWADRYPRLGVMRDGGTPPGDTAAVRLLRAWTRLEAVVKCRGDRLDQALDERPDPARLAALQAIHVNDLALGPGLIGACACGQPMTIELTTAAPAILRNA